MSRDISDISVETYVLRSDTAPATYKPPGKPGKSRASEIRGSLWDLGHGFEGWLYVVRPERKQPLRALEITAPAASVLHDEDFELNAWLLKHAPHIQQIGSAGG